MYHCDWMMASMYCYIVIRMLTASKQMLPKSVAQHLYRTLSTWRWWCWCWYGSHLFLHRLQCDCFSLWPILIDSNDCVRHSNHYHSKSLRIRHSYYFYCCQQLHSVKHIWWKMMIEVVVVVVMMKMSVYLLVSQRLWFLFSFSFIFISIDCVCFVCFAWYKQMRAKEKRNTQRWWCRQHIHSTVSFRLVFFYYLFWLKCIQKKETERKSITFRCECVCGYKKQDAVI